MMNESLSYLLNNAMRLSSFLFTEDGEMKSIIKSFFIINVTTSFWILFTAFMFFWIANRQTAIRNSTKKNETRSRLSRQDRFRVKSTHTVYSIAPPATEPQIEPDDDDDHDREDIIQSTSTGAKDKTNTDAASNLSSSAKRQIFPHRQRQDLLEVASKLKIFSFLNVEAFEMVMNAVEYLDFPRTGMPLSGNDNPLDGSLYVVIEGEVTCSCQINSKSYLGKKVLDCVPLTFEAAAGDIVTSLLSMLCALVKEYDMKEPTTEYDYMQDVDVFALTSKPNTRLIRIAPSCFLEVLNKFPQDVCYIVQTILGRTHRVMVHTLVDHLNLRDEIWNEESIEVTRHTLTSESRDTTLNEFSRLANELYRLDGADNHQDTALLLDVPDDLKKQVTVATSEILGIENPRIDALDSFSKSSSILLVSPGVTLMKEGSRTNHVYMVIAGKVEIGTTKEIKHKGGLGQSKTNITDTKSKINMRRSMANTVSAWNNSNKSSRDFMDEKLPPFRRYYGAVAGDILGALECFVSDTHLNAVRVPPTESQPAIVVRIPKNVYMKYLSTYPKVLKVCLKYLIGSKMPSIVRLLDWGLQWMNVKTGEIVVSRGTPCDSFFIVLSGSLRSNDGKNDNEQIWTKFGRGSCIGGLQILTGESWPGDVHAVRNSELAIVPFSVLDAIMNMFPKALAHFTRVVTTQGIKRNDNMSTMESYGLSIATVAVIPLYSNANEDSSQFCSLLLNAMEKIAPSTLITKSRARACLKSKSYEKDNPVHQDRLTRLLGDLEENNRVVIYQAEQKFTWWTKVSIEHADCVLLAVKANEVPEKSKVDEYLAFLGLSHPVKVHLVKIQNADFDSKLGRGVNDWNEQRPYITNHHLVRQPYTSNVMDINRLCRRITGRSLGLALGGGGARGLAHLGVIRALREAGVTVDMVGGTSQGAFIGALYSQYPDDYETLIAKSKRMAVRLASVKDKLLDLTFPVVSYFNGSRFNDTIIESVGEHTRIQDLILTYFCVTTDICQSSEVIHTKGCCWKYVRASMSLQGYLPPICENGMLLLDGGYANVVPGDVMAKQGAKTVIAVDVSGEVTHDYYEYGTHLSGFWILWNSWNPFTKTVRIPSMGELARRLIWVSSLKKSAEVADSVDLFLRPPVQDYGTLDFDKFDDIVQVGYEYTKHNLPFFFENESVVSGWR
jgi:lysophospholipid hydrolase